MTERLIKEALVPSEYQGQRVDLVLAKLFPEFSRSQLSQWLKEATITINQKPYKPKDKVYGGELIKLQVVLATPKTEHQPEELPLSIVYEDDDLMVINKPSGLVVHPGAGNPQHTLVNALLYHEPRLAQLPRAGIIHRLDKETTGLLVVAKTLEAHTSLVRQMQARQIQRQYLALVYGHLVSGGTVDTFYGRHPHHRLKMAVCQQGKQAITHYSINKQFQYATLLDVNLLTGRTHQIRVHMAHIKHPIIGDPLYGGPPRFPRGAQEALRDALKNFKRQALHASRLSLTHPRTEEFLTFTAALPDDFKFLLTQLEVEID